MSRRTGVSVVAVAAVVAAWSLGSTVIATAGLTLTVVAVATWAWGRQVARRAGVTRLVETRKLVEGDSLRYRIVRTAPRLPGTFVLEESLSRLGVQSLELTRPTTEARLPAVPAGAFASARRDSWRPIPSGSRASSSSAKGSTR